MKRSVKVLIELNYDADDFTAEPLEKLSEADLRDLVEDRVYEDLMDLMRGDRLTYWAEVTVEDVK